MNTTAHSNDPAPYITQPHGEDWIIAEALRILDARCQRGQAMDSPSLVGDWLALRAAGLQREVFTVVFLDSQHRLIEAQDMFHGTLTQTSVYPREVLAEALRLHAAAVILSHNHPSGIPTPSRADEMLTQTLKQALALVDVRVLDHIIVAGGQARSMAELGMV